MILSHRLGIFGYKKLTEKLNILYKDTFFYFVATAIAVDKQTFKSP